jgi:hypothetical protein
MVIDKKNSLRTVYSSIIEIHIVNTRITKNKNSDFKIILPGLQKLAKHLLQINQGTTTQIIFLHKDHKTTKNKIK